VLEFLLQHPFDAGKQLGRSDEIPVCIELYLHGIPFLSVMTDVPGQPDASPNPAKEGMGPLWALRRHLNVRDPMQHCPMTVKGRNRLTAACRKP
jgi:hypothetical protein